MWQAWSDTQQKQKLYFVFDFVLAFLQFFWDKHLPEWLQREENQWYFKCMRRSRRQSCKETCWLLLLHSLSALAHIVSFTILSLNLLLASELWCTACLFCLRTDMPTPTLHATFSDYQAGAENLHKLVSVTQRLAAAQFTLWVFWGGGGVAELHEFTGLHLRVVNSRYSTLDILS